MPGIVQQDSIFFVLVQRCELRRHSAQRWACLLRNSTLADAAYRLKDFRQFEDLGYAGRSNISAVTAMPEVDLDPMIVTRMSGEHLLYSGYYVGGIDKALIMSVAVVGVGEGGGVRCATLGRAGHQLRIS
jgi:hypothetical protein